MSQIRKGFIAANAIDGSKLKLLNNEAIRAAQADGADVELMKLDGSNVLQFLKMPQVSADPSQGNDVARKSYVDAQVSAAGDSAASGLASEQSARESADSGLQSAIDTEKGRIDAILSAATADADSFAEIVNLINSVDTESDSAFGSYVISNNAALAQESADRAAGDAGLASDVADEASARQSADTALQGNLDQEVSDRQAAVSSEASARQSADNDLQATIDALDVNDLGSVNITSAADGDLWQFDLESGKWVNVAPLSEAGTSGGGGGGGGTESVYLTQAGQSSDGTYEYTPTYERGFSFIGNGESLTKAGLNLTYLSGSGNVKLVVRDTLGGTVLAESNSVDITTLSFAQTTDFTFASPATVASGTRYYVEMNLTGGSVGFQWNTGNIDSYGVNYYWYIKQSFDSYSQGQSETAGALAATLYTTAGGSDAGSESPLVGVIKTNESGQLDDSFVSSAIARVSDMEAADGALQGNLDSESSARQDADGTLQSNIDSEVSARQAAVSSEQADRENADAGLQSQIDALDSGSNAALAQEVSDRQAADSAEQTAREGADATLQGNIDSEAASRQSADTTLQGNIDTEKARIDAILTASSADKDSFAEIVNLINSVDTENDSAFGSYVVSNNAALAQEVSDRQAAVSAEQSAREAADSAETAARQAADTSLQGEVDAVESALAQEVSDRTDAVSAEQSARETADQGLQDAIDALDSGNAAALAQEVSDRVAGDAAEQAAREAADSAETAAREAADSAEQTAREGADSALQAAVDQEVSDRTAADSAEQTAREAADSAEQSAREGADDTLQGNIDSEESAREAADGALDTRVTALEAVAHYKAKFVLSATDISNGYVDLAMECTPDSEMVFVGALYLHSGDHYTVSTVGGCSRLTWAGDVMAAGPSELVSGDIVYVRYTSSATPGGNDGGGEEFPPFDPNDADGNGIPDSEEGGGEEPPLNPDM